MGYGDNIMATGFARGAATRGKRVAFGDGKKIIWDFRSPEIFKGNPNVAPPGSERDIDIEWHPFRRGNRQYIQHDQPGNRWIWNYDFRAPRGEMFFTDEELRLAEKAGSGFVLIEPSVPDKPQAVNKQWLFQNYALLSRGLVAKGYQVRQFVNPMADRQNVQLIGSQPIHAPTFRVALAVMQRAALFVGSEGGLHHGAAAVGTPAVVIFGAWIPPEVTGYQEHVNIARGKPCGSLGPCEHCRKALQQIEVKEVFDAAISQLEKHGARGRSAGGG